jgi:adenylate cyclase
MEPEDLTALMNEYLSEMTNIATKHGGTIDKFRGDAMMVIFAAPTLG